MKKTLLISFTFLLTGLNLISQNIGIGVTAPTAKLEIKGDATTSTTNALIIRNGSGDTLLRVKNNGNINIGYNGVSSGRTINIGRTGANFFSDDVNFGGAVFPTDTSLVLWSQSEDNNYVILQPSWGKVGVGTYSPKAKFEVKGNFILGNGGSVITTVIKLTVSKDIGSVSAETSSTQTFVVAGASTGATVHISPASALPNGLVIAYARVSALNTVEVKFMNTTAGTLNPALMDYYITVIE